LVEELNVGKDIGALLNRYGIHFMRGTRALKQIPNWNTETRTDL
jgi:hypothetical protein